MPNEKALSPIYHVLIDDLSKWDGLVGVPFIPDSISPLQKNIEMNLLVNGNFRVPNKVKTKKNSLATG